VAAIGAAAAMNLERWMRLWDLVAQRTDGGPVGVEDVCAVAITACGVDRCSIAVTLPGGGYEAVYASDPTAADIEELTLTVGEGPGVDALAGRPALVADLTVSEWSAQWPAFAPAAVLAGVRAIFAMPMQVGGVRLGVLTLSRARSGGLDREQLADALVLTGVACAVLLDAAGRDIPGDGHSAPDQPWEPLGPHPPEVHQATGMITVQLGVSVAVALSRMRAYAYASDRRLRDVAADVVARRLRFVPDTVTGSGDVGLDP
jgi:hypothetical protein